MDRDIHLVLLEVFALPYDYKYTLFVFDYEHLDRDGEASRHFYNVKELLASRAAMTKMLVDIKVPEATMPAVQVMEQLQYYYDSLHNEARAANDLELGRWSRDAR